MADQTSVDYEKLKQIASIFADKAETANAMKCKLTAQIDALRGRGWIGEGANAFYHEMDNLLLPGLARFHQAMHQAEALVKDIDLAMRQAEEDGEKIVSKQGGTDNGNGTAPEKGGPPPAKIPGAVHTVKPGDTLWDIAQRYGTTVDALVAANNITNRDLIYPGQEIIIPGAEPVPAPVPGGSPGDIGAASRTGQQLNTKIDSFNVAGNPKYAKGKDGNPNTYDTYCNLFASDVAKGFGAPLPLFVTNNGVKKWLGATAMKQWLDGELNVAGQYTQGPANGWFKVDATTAAAAANNGHLAVAAGHGHMAVVRAGSPAGVSKGDVLIAQAGARNFNAGKLKDGWGRFTGEAEFYIYKP